MSEEFTEEITIDGPLGDFVNGYLGKMISYFKNNDGDLFSWLLTLPEKDLAFMSIIKDEDDDEDEFDNLSRTLAIMSFTLEKSDDTGTCEAKVNDFLRATYLFKIMCGMAFTQKLGLMNFEMNKSFFDEDCMVTVCPSYPLKRGVDE